MTDQLAKVLYENRREQVNGEDAERRSYNPKYDYSKKKCRRRNLARRLSDELNAQGLNAEADTVVRIVS